MNIDFRFKLLPNKIKMERRQRAYEICFNFTSFRTNESEDANEVNAGNLRFIYCPKEFLLEFHSFQEYIDTYTNISISLEVAAWSILDDVFDKVQPCYAIVIVESELPDGATVNIKAQRGWQKEKNAYLSPHMQQATII
ncbi:hypothetical protein ACNVED_05525 [Legionella sp. D16C41]|uniref:hypothetical protein n=1 Tax=Legionella sp. D16C41 TaxID=3402688 RepID=UPI003AF9333A